jgi:hypothetical protein
VNIRGQDGSLVRPFERTHGEIRSEVIDQNLSFGWAQRPAPVDHLVHFASPCLDPKTLLLNQMLIVTKKAACFKQR